MKNRRNYYRILHVQPDAPGEIIKASYRTLMQKLKLHPDLGGDNWNASILNEAHTVLTNPEKRAAYDRQFLHRFRARHTQARRQKHSEKKQQQSSNTRYYRKDASRCPFCGAAKPVLFRYSNSGNCNHCHSPLRPVVRLHLAGKLRRALQRTSHHTPIRYFTHQGEITGIPGTTRDLSPHGMQFSTVSRLDKNQVIRITSGVLSAIARVTYCRQHKGRKEYTVGVEFLTLNFHERTGTFISENA